MTLDIALVTPAFLRHDGTGRATRAKRDAWRAQGHQVTVYGPVHGPLGTLVTEPVLWLDVLEVVRAFVHKTTHPFLSHQLYVYEVPVWYPALLTVQLVGNSPVVFDYHGLTPVALVADDLTRSVLALSRERLKQLRRGALTVVHSQFASRELAGAGGPPPEQHMVVPVPVATELTGPADPMAAARVRSRWKLGPSRLLLFVGRTAGNKGLGTLVDVTARLVAAGHDVALVLCGDDRTGELAVHSRAAREKARRLGIDPRVVFTGSVDDPTLRDLYDAADLLVTASLHEGFCVPVAEAFTRGCPAVVTDAGALPETAAGGAIIVPGGDTAAFVAAVAALLTDEASRKRLCADAVKCSERFQEAAVGELWKSVIDRARLGPGPGPVDPLDLMDLVAQTPLDLSDPFTDRGPAGLLAWFRRKVTLPLEKFFVRVLIRRFRLSAGQVTGELRRLESRINDLETGSVSRGEPREEKRRERQSGT